MRDVFLDLSWTLMSGKMHDPVCLPDAVYIFSFHPRSPPARPLSCPLCPRPLFNGLTSTP